ncbi:MAG: TRAP transporter small permease [Nitrospirota bacterium]
MLLLLEKISKYLNRLLIVLGGAALLCLTFLATGNVLSRIFHAPFRGTYEVVAFLGALVTAFALGFTQEKKDHIVVDILTDKFPPPVKKALDRFNYFIAAVLFAVITWQVYRWGQKIREAGELSETLQIVFYPFIFCVALGFAVQTFTLVVDFLKTFQRNEGEHQ